MSLKVAPFESMNSKKYLHMKIISYSKELFLRIFVVVVGDFVKMLLETVLHNYQTIFTQMCSDQGVFFLYSL